LQLTSRSKSFSKSIGLHECHLHVIYTAEASKDLDGILAYIASNYPTVYEAFLMRLRSVTARIGMWPDSAQEVAEEPSVRVVPLLRYPYKIFYRNTGEAIETLAIHHAARDERRNT
jgi:plasmid stabilization system protein ParE